MDPILILLALGLVGLIIFQSVQGRKRRRETEERVAKFVPGVEVMTNFGLYGTIVSIDDDKNLAVLETSPGVSVKVHRQVILKVADYDTPVDGDEDAGVVSNTDADADVAAVVVDAETGVPVEKDTAARLDEPAFGERLDEPGARRRASDTRASDTRAGDAKADD